MGLSSIDITPNWAENQGIFLKFLRGDQGTDGTLAVVLPEMDTDYPLNSCQISFKACYSPADSIMNHGKLAIGIMTNPNDFSTFEKIEDVEINNELELHGNNYNFATYTVQLSSYTGNGQYIAIQDVYTDGLSLAQEPFR